jgi:hypothetical protein
MAESSKKGVLYTKTTWQTKGSESDQVGWLRTECAYSPNTLIGNWNEKRFDVSLLSQAKPLPSQVKISLDISFDLCEFTFSSTIIISRAHTLSRFPRNHRQYQKH